jgi:hypothetical protein
MIPWNGSLGKIDWPSNRVETTLRTRRFRMTGGNLVFSGPGVYHFSDPLVDIDSYFLTLTPVSFCCDSPRLAL